MSELKVVSINPNSNNTTSDENVIIRLEEALEFAKNGNISNCLVIMVSNTGEVLDCWANRNKPYVMVGALESLKMEFMSVCIESRD